MEWLLSYLETLTPNQKSNVVHTPGNSSFKFSHICRLIPSVQQVILPEILIDNFRHSIQVEVVTENIPLLLAETEVIKHQETRKTPYNVNRNYSSTIFMGPDKEEEMDIATTEDQSRYKIIDLKELRCSRKEGERSHSQRKKCKTRKEDKQSCRKQRKKNVIDMKQTKHFLDLNQKQVNQLHEKWSKKRRYRKLNKLSWRKRRKKRVIHNIRQGQLNTISSVSKTQHMKMKGREFTGNRNRWKRKRKKSV